MRTIRGWLQMKATNEGAAWERPSSAASYRQHGAVYSAVYPINGGACDATGDWVQDATLYDANLKPLAHSRDQLYMPTVWIESGATFQTVLDDAGLSAAAIANLVTLATTRAHDGPWDGVDFDVEGVADGYKNKLTAWFDDAATALHAEGLQVNITAIASDRDSGLPYNRHVFDFAALANIADTITPMLYTSFGMHPNTAPGPYDLADRVLAYILSKGVRPGQLYAGLSIASRYATVKAYTSHANALAILDNAGAIARWYEIGDDGRLFRLKRGTWGNDGQLWLVDIDTLRAHLELVEKYDLAGVCLFVLGSEDRQIWSLLAEQEPELPQASKLTDFFTRALTGAAEMVH